eukprot:SRR837773.21596.p1 GENE.SRR837773.21596~~SRR837773.21596.p1  ORF type:complete len:161 (+),score=56.65 SRR837773.21596:47-484(+)
MNAFLKWLKKPDTAKAYPEMHKNIDAFISKANAEFKAKGYPIELANWFSVWSILYKEPGRYHWMFQYYLKDAGVNLSWVGTGRLLFSLEWTKKDYDRLLERMLVACEAMKQGGWWEPPVGNIKKALMGEIASAVAKNVFKLFASS